MKETALRFDLVWASGVLYHMSDPIGFLESVSRVSDCIFIWTHYVDADEMPQEDPRRHCIIGEELVRWRKHVLRLHRRSYFDRSKSRIQKFTRVCNVLRCVW